MREEFPSPRVTAPEARRMLTAAEALDMSDGETSSAALAIRHRADVAIRRACRHGTRRAKVRDDMVLDWLGEAPSSHGGEIHPVEEAIALLEADGFTVDAQVRRPWLTWSEESFTSFDGADWNNVRAWLAIYW